MIYQDNLLTIFKHRTSVRDFKNEPLSEEILAGIQTTINCAPTSLNGHDFSAIIVTNHELKQALASLNKYEKQIADCGAFVVFLMDGFALDYCQEMTREHLDNYFAYERFMSCITDATIACTMVQDYALSLGLGTCYIGALRYNVKQVQTILKLPVHILPVIGLCVGYIQGENDLKPKLEKVMFNEYQPDYLKTNIHHYDQVMKDYYLTRNIHDDFAHHTMSHYLKTNSVKNHKELDYLNEIITTY